MFDYVGFQNVSDTLIIHVLYNTRHIVILYLYTRDVFSEIIMKSTIMMTLSQRWINVADVDSSLRQRHIPNYMLSSASSRLVSSCFYGDFMGTDHFTIGIEVCKSRWQRYIIVGSLSPTLACVNPVFGQCSGSAPRVVTNRINYYWNVQLIYKGSMERELYGNNMTN